MKDKLYSLWTVVTQRTPYAREWKHWFASKADAEKFIEDYYNNPYQIIKKAKYMGRFKKENAEFLLGKDLK